MWKILGCGFPSSLSITSFFFFFIIIKGVWKRCITTGKDSLCCSFGQSTAYCSSMESVISTLADAVPDFESSSLVFISTFTPSFDLKDLNLDSADLLLGTRTFGATYALRVNHELKIAVKRLKCDDISESCFRFMMGTIGEITHQNVVPLRSYYSHNGERLMLFDYYKHGSVFDLLHGKKDERTVPLDWPFRLSIAVGAARGIAEIHKNVDIKFVHGNIKSTNIFIDSKGFSCISDFGLATMMDTTYMPTSYCNAPEINGNARNVSQKSDVYSFGIFLLELLTRKSPLHVPGGGAKAVDLVKLLRSIRSKMWPSSVFYVERWYTPAVKQQMMNVLKIAISCVSMSREKRPTMADVVSKLEDLIMPLLPDLILSNGIPVYNLEELLRASSEYSDILGIFNRRYKFRDICAATNYFSPANELRRTGFGVVHYKGTLENGKTISVKKFSDDVEDLNFVKELLLTASFEHVNLLKILGFAIKGKERLMMYEFLPHLSLDRFIFFSEDPRPPSRRSPQLDWDTRYKIIKGIGRGLVHLHQRSRFGIIHCDIKPNAILLDSDMNPRIADFDIARFSVNETGETLDKIVGTAGYMAPEYVFHGQISAKADVYAFGLLVLNIISGQRTHSIMDILTSRSVETSWLNATMQHLIDPVLKSEPGSLEDMIRCIHIGLHCVQENAADRPTMTYVVTMLDGLD